MRIAWRVVATFVGLSLMYVLLLLTSLALVESARLISELGALDIPQEDGFVFPGHPLRMMLNHRDTIVLMLLIASFLREGRQILSHIRESIIGILDECVKFIAAVLVSFGLLKERDGDDDLP